MAHVTTLTKAYSANTGTANTFSYSGSFDVFKASEVIVKLDDVALTYKASIDNESADPRQYSVDVSAKTIHIGGANLSSGTVAIYPKTDMGNPTAHATYTPGSTIDSSDLNDNQKQALRKLMELDEQKRSTLVDVPVADIAKGSARQLIQTNAGATAAEWTSNVDIPGTLDVTGAADFDSTVNIDGAATLGSTLNVSGTITGNLTGNVTGNISGLAGTASLATESTNVTVTSNNSTNETVYPVFVDGEQGTQGIESDTGLTYNPSTGALTTATVVGNVTGNVTGNVVGNVTGNVTGTSGSTTGNAATATDLAAAAKVTNSEQASHSADDSTYFTTSASDARYFNISSGDTIKDGQSFPNNDTSIATTAAINDRIIDLVDDVGGFVPIADETEFPDSNPDVNDGAGTIVSIKEIATGWTTSNDGSDSDTIKTISNGNVSDSQTITINGLTANTTYPAGMGMLVETTTTNHTYRFHRLTPKATEVTTVAGIQANVTTVAGIASNVSTVAGISGNVTTVAGISSQVSTVASNNSNVTTVGTNISSVNNFADLYQIDDFSPSAPNTDGGGNSLAAGDLAFDTTAGQLKAWNGSAWATGVTAPADLISKNTIDAKGDILTGTADNTIARTAVGTNGKFLKADSSAAGGVSWDTVTQTDTTYSISCVDGDNSDEEKIRLTAGGSGSGTDDVVLEAGTGLSIARSGDKITFTNTVSDTNTQLSTEEVQDIVGAMVAGNTETNIAVTYDDTNGKLNFVSTDTNTTYSVGDGGLTQNNFTNTLKTKLDGIEASADVTDATNVNSAGAVMNSDLDGKGELLVGDGSGDPSALAVGTNNYVLTADSNEATGVKWAAVSGGSDTTYAISCVDGDNSDEEKIRLTAGGSGSGTDDIVLEAGTGLSIARSGDKITFTNTVADTTLNLIDEDDLSTDSATRPPSQQSVKAYVDAQTLSLIDEDNMSSNSATRPPSQQSVKAYVDSNAGTTINNATANELVTVASTTSQLDAESSLTFQDTATTGLISGRQVTGRGFECPATVSDDWTIAAGNNAMFPGPMTVAATKTVTIPANRTLTIV